MNHHKCFINYKCYKMLNVMLSLWMPFMKVDVKTIFKLSVQQFPGPVHQRFYLTDWSPRTTTLLNVPWLGPVSVGRSVYRSIDFLTPPTGSFWLCWQKYRKYWFEILKMVFWSIKMLFFFVILWLFERCFVRSCPSVIQCYHRLFSWEGVLSIICQSFCWQNCILFSKLLI